MPSAEPLSAATNTAPQRFIRRNVSCTSRSSIAPLERRAVRERPHSGHGSRGAGRVHDRRGTARPDARARGAALLQPAQVGVGDEPLGVGPGDHDGADAIVGLGAGDERL